MARTGRRFGAVATSVALLATLVSVQVGAQEGRTIPVERLPADATALSVRLSALAFPDGAATVLVARRDGFADALASGALQGDAPLLLVDGQQQVSAEVLAEVSRLGADVALVLGGAAAVSDTTQQSLRDAGLEVRRLSRGSRIGTAVEIAVQAVADGADGAEVILTRAFGADGDETRAFADALVAGAVAAEQRRPLLLTDSASLSAETAEALSALGVEDVVVVGGPAAISAAVEDQLRDQAGVRTRRVAGASRTETAVALHRLRSSSGQTASTALVIDSRAADAWVAGFAGAAFAARTGAPVVLSAGSTLEQGARDILDEAQPDRILCAAPRGACDAAVEAAGGVPDDGQVGDLRVTPAMLPAPQDFATDVHGDPWDYANSEDILLEQGPMQAAGDARLADGMASWTSNAGYVHLHWPVFPDSIPNQRDGEVNPINGDVYRRFSMRVNPSVPVDMALAWQSCPGVPGSCNTFGPLLRLQPGWQTVALELPWSGPIFGLRLSTTSPAAIQLDDVRIMGPSLVTGTITGATGAISVEPLDAGLQQAVTRGLPRTIAGGTLDPAILPPGTYQLTDEAGDSTRVTIVEPPRLRILDPDVTGGEDYAEVTTGDPWDFAQTTDALEVGNARDVVWADGRVRAVNTNDDPFVQLRMGPVPLDPDRYHRVTVRFGNDGPLDLSFAPGGGSHGRLLFRAPGEGEDRTKDGADIVAYPQYRSFTFSMKGPDTVEFGRTWTGAPIGHLRFDPNEDPGPRGWYVEDLRIRADDESSGAFTIRIADITPAELRVGPTSVEVGIDQDQAGFDGIVLARDLRTEGTLDVPISTCGLAPGTFHVWVRATNGVASSASYATGPLQVTNTAC